MTGTIAGLPVLSASDHSDKFNMLIYGDAGGGKTTLASSASEVEELSPVLLVDVEGGTRSIAERYPEVQVVRVKNDFDAKGRIIRSAWESLEGLGESLKKGEGDYKTIIIDSLSEVYWLHMAHWMDYVVAESPDRDRDIPSQRDWGKTSARIKHIVRKYRDLDRNVIFTCLKSSVTTDSGAVTEYTPGLPGKLAYEISAFVDEVFYLYTKTEKEATKRILLTGNAKKYIAKDRSGKLPLTIENPSMANIVTMMKEGSK